MDPLRASLRLELSDGEIACPAKGGAVLAIGRCLANQRETGAAGKVCTCDVYRARAKVAVTPDVRQALEAPAEPEEDDEDLVELPAEEQERRRRKVSTLPPRDRRDLIARAAKARQGVAPRPPRAVEQPQEARATSPSKEEPMAEKNGGTGAVLAAMAAEPARAFSSSEVAEIKGGSRKAVNPMMLRLIRQGKVVRAGEGGYRIAKGVEAPAPKTERSKRAAPAPAPSGDVLARLSWEAEGCRRGFLTHEELGRRVAELLS